MSIYLFSPIKIKIYLSVDLIIVLSADTQTWHDYNAFQLPNSTAQCEQIDVTMKAVSEDSSCSKVGWGARAACPEVSAGSVEDSKAKHGPACTED
jgi:hypothetical protein